MTTGASASAAIVRAAMPQDVAGITRCVCAAYLRYIERVGKQPWPMLQDYSNVIRTSQVHVAERDGCILGVLELLVTDQGLLLDSIAVEPSAQGTGIERQLLLFAEGEAKRQGFDSIYLMTNEKMTENQELYARIGYVLFDRQTVHGYSRVLFHPDFTFRGSLGPALVGHEQFIGYVHFVTGALDRYTSDILALGEEGRQVFGKLRFHGYHRRELFNIPPSSRHVWWYGTPIFTSDGERIRDLWVLGDIYGLIGRLKGESAA